MISPEAIAKLNSTESIAKYKEILKNNGIVDPVEEIIEEDSSLRGHGGGSDRRYVTVKFKNPELPPLNLFSKVIVAGNPAHMEIVRGVKAFEKETAFLTKYLPAAKEFCKQKGLDETLFMDIYPKCYYGDDNMIVMENLVLQGYEIVGMEERHDWDTATLVLESMAKHHALSYAMIMQNGGPEKFFQKYVPINYDGFADPHMASIMGSWLHSTYETNVKILELNSNVRGAQQALDYLRILGKKKESIAELWRSSLLKDENDREMFQLLNHGDMWCTNMMFLRNPTTKKVVHNKLYDFQILRHNSPACDLSFYLFTSVKTDVRQGRFQDLLQFYLSNLQKLSTKLGYPIDERKLSYADLLFQYRKRIHYALFSSFFTQYGATKQITKDVELTKLDPGEWGTVLTKLVAAWITKYPDEARKLSEELVLVLHEAEKLEL